VVTFAGLWFARTDFNAAIGGRGKLSQSPLTGVGTFPRKWVSISLSYPLHIVGTAPELVVGQGIHLDSLLNEAIEE